MNTAVLVAYATRYGSTQEVAEVVASALREHQLTVDLQPMHEVQAIDEYRAVLLGAPLYLGHWHKDACQFLAQHREALMERPIVVFALGPLQNPPDAEEWQSAREQLDHELAQFPWLHPLAVEVFGGMYDPQHLRFTDRLLASLPASPLHHMPAHDARNWSTILTWANHLAEQLQPALQQEA